MATFFGEVNSMLSRAVVDEDALEYKMLIDYANQKEKAVFTCKLLLFSIGKLPTAFVKNNLIPGNARKLFKINYMFVSDENDDSLMYTGRLRASSVFSAAEVTAIDSDLIVCEVPIDVPVEIQFKLSKMISQKVNSSEVLILTSQHITAFKSQMPQPFQSSFLRSLANVAYMEAYSCKIERLQVPNYICGFAAAIMAEFNIQNKPTLCVIGYVDSDMLASLHINLFNCVLQEELCVKFTVVKGDIKPSYPMQSNLYT